LSGHDELEHFTTTASSGVVKLLHEDPSLRECIRRILPAQKLPDDSVCRGGGVGRALEASNTTGKVRGRNRGDAPGTVVIGVIEEGIAIANHRFRRSNRESRVEYAWVQDARCVGDVEGFGYGRELRKSNGQLRRGGIVDKGIDELLLECTRGGQVNEDLFYAKAGLADFSRQGHKAVAQRASHGALVMDLACGYDQGTSPTGRGGLEHRPIVCVQLPTITVADTSGLGLERYMLDGLHYILDRADRIAVSRGCDPLPVVVNFSSGVLAGPHDGSHPIEAAIDETIEWRRQFAPTEVVLPAGNSYLSRIHASVLVPANGGEASLPWHVLPDDKTCTYVELWLPQPQPGYDSVGAEIMLEPPGGARSPALSDAKSARAVAWRPGGRDAICKIYYEYVGPPTNRGRYLIALVPTACDKAPSQLAPCGTWKIVLRNRTYHPIDSVNAWIQWDDRPLGFPRTGRQSYFSDATYRRFDEISGRAVETDNTASLVRRSGTISAIATGVNTVVVGGFKQKEATIVNYSGAGPTATRPSGRSGPDAAVVTDDSSIHRGIFAAGTRSRSIVAVNGTSVAAPQVTRYLADCLAAGDRRSGREVVTALAKLQESRRPPLPSRPSEERAGSGRIVLPRNGSRVGNRRILCD
jgi:hypothetical protein